MPYTGMLPLLDVHEQQFQWPGNTKIQFTLQGSLGSLKKYEKSAVITRGDGRFDFQTVK